MEAKCQDPGRANISVQTQRQQKTDVRAQTIKQEEVLLLMAGGEGAVRILITFGPSVG